MDLVPVASLWGVIFFRLFLDFGFLATYAFSAGLFRVSVLFFFISNKVATRVKIFQIYIPPPVTSENYLFLISHVTLRGREGGRGGKKRRGLRHLTS